MIESFFRWLEIRRCRRAIERTMQREPLTHRAIIGLKTDTWAHLNKTGDTVAVVVRDRMVRGDLITVRIGNNVAAEWVDQSHAYGGFLGINDFVCTPAFCEKIIL